MSDSQADGQGTPAWRADTAGAKARSGNLAPLVYREGAASGRRFLATVRFVRAATVTESALSHGNFPQTTLCVDANNAHAAKGQL